MKKINLKTGLGILAVYEILYWMVVLLFQPYGGYMDGDEEFNAFVWSVGVPIAIILIYFIINWVSKKK